jgi:glyoxylase-like metal-dependent hydrolase (beta-lactamase superfamily II)
MEIFACIIGRALRSRHFMFHLSNEVGEVELVYPFWVIRDAASRPILIDTGFAEQVALRRGVGAYVDPGRALATLGISPAEIELVAVSHLHYDHFGMPERYPNAVFAVQREDLDYFNRRGLKHPARALADEESLARLAGLGASGRLRALDGATRLAPGIRLVPVGGHTPGMQIVVCEAGASRVVLACDASHFYANLEERRPTAIIHDYEAYQRGFETIEREAGAGRWFPGHDPAILLRLEEVAPAVWRVPAA